MNDTRQAPPAQLAEINAAVRTSPAAFVAQEDARYDAALDRLAGQLRARKSRYTIVMLSGPSGSGKTTTAALLAKKLAALGTDAVTVSLDNFYLGAGKAPRLPDGSFDYETVRALDLAELHACLLALLERGRCDVPHFDFKRSRPSQHRLPVSLEEGGAVILEGIHAMNPVVVQTLPQDCLCRLYVSVERGVFDGERELLSPRDVRLVRRMTRDDLFRNSPPVRTLEMWRGVVRGEEQYLFPYRDTADYQLDTFHAYEPCLFRGEMLRLLASVGPQDCGYAAARRLLGAMEGFAPLEARMAPPGSMLREFIGGGADSF